MMLVDTHIWIWWTLDPSQLTARQWHYLDRSGETIGLCSVSLREIAAAVERGRLEIDADLSQWLGETTRSHRVSLLPLTPEIAIESVQLPGDFHRDPFDQMIVATARRHNCTLVTSDHMILGYPYVRTLR